MKQGSLPASVAPSMFISFPGNATLINMLHLHTSKTLNETLQKAGCDCVTLPEGPAWHWHAHRFSLHRKRCIIVMEEESRYVIFFLGLKKKDLAQFDQVLADRILAEARWLCNLDAEQGQQLSDVLKERVQPASFSTGMNRSVQSHVRQAIEEADIHTAYHLDRVPETTDEILSLGLRINDTIRKRKQDCDYFVPLEKWREGLLALIRPHLSGKVINLAEFRSRHTPR